ncbi:MAG: DotG/IcmE/VirB10 family protein [Desulfobacteraceae bacterium]|nr:DotG/IcmE/VirB10 family protein [Desulfobacteraceae bacterium]
MIEYGNIGAEKAQKQGKDYIPPVVKHAPDNLSLDEPEKKEIVVVEKATLERDNTSKPATIRPAQSQQQADPRAQALKNSILEEMNVISEKMKVQGHATTVFSSIKQEDEQSQQSAPNQTVAMQESFENVMADLGVKPGDVFYSVTRETLNSDAPGTKMTTAEILSGKLKGYRVVGSFVRENKFLVVRYSKIVSPDDTVYDIEGFAVDPTTKSAGVRSNVDHHYLSRWGGLVAASFLQGFGEAVANSGVSANNSWGDAIVTTTPDYNAEDQAWIAAGKVGEVMSSKASKNFDRDPTVTLNEGLPIGVLIIDITNPKK